MTKKEIARLKRRKRLDASRLALRQRTRKCYRHNPLSSNMKWGIAVVGGLAAVGVLAYFVTKPTAAALPSAPPAPSNTTELVPGTMSLPYKAGEVFTLTLPAGSEWDPDSNPNHNGAIIVNGNISIRVAPSSGSTPASFVYNGTGASVFVYWKASGTGGGVPRTTSVLLSS